MADNSMSGRVGALVIGGVLIAGAFFIGNTLSGFNLFGGGEEFTQVGQTVVEQVQNVAKLTTVEVIESTTIEKGNDFGWLNWARGDSIFMFVVVEIGAGIDFEKFNTGSFEVDESTGTVTVHLPPAEILNVSLDNQQTQVIDRSTGVLTGGNPQLESDARQVAEQVLVDNAVASGILETADENARTVIEGLLLKLGYERVIFVEPRAGG